MVAGWARRVTQKALPDRINRRNAPAVFWEHGPLRDYYLHSPRGASAVRRLEDLFPGRYRRSQPGNRPGPSGDTVKHFCGRHVADFPPLQGR